MEVHANSEPPTGPGVHLRHPVEQLPRRLLTLDAVHTNVPPKLNSERELRLKHAQLVGERNGERGQVAPAWCSGIWGIRGMGEGDTTSSVKPYFPEECVRERGKAFA